MVINQKLCECACVCSFLLNTNINHAAKTMNKW